MDLDGLISKFEKMDEEIEKDVGKLVLLNTIDQTNQTKRNEVQRFDKGYWTGNMWRNTETYQYDRLHAATIPGTEYAAYMNYGTRYIEPTWFLRDAFKNQKKLFLSDLDKLMKG